MEWVGSVTSVSVGTYLRDFGVSRSKVSKFFSKGTPKGGEMLKFGVESSQLHVRLDETFYPGFYPVAYFSYIVTTFLLWSTIHQYHEDQMNESPFSALFMESWSSKQLATPPKVQSQFVTLIDDHATNHLIQEDLHE
ncbi:hypothetical protein EYC84_007947 [Monilinia fructicola]|uniref:Uncharacterized protein n=1 Tax=Monilinia fructicola TaxID=38448 RepID=A0A5M9JMJ0_MONFR|nr:hypothetical protein EYC84_007947 [Monilinia fructicola]